eukprot:gene12650-biopygen6893
MTVQVRAAAMTSGGRGARSSRRRDVQRRSRTSAALELCRAGLSWAALSRLRVHTGSPANAAKGLSPLSRLTHLGRMWPPARQDRVTDLRCAGTAGALSFAVIHTPAAAVGGHGDPAATQLTPLLPE